MAVGAAAVNGRPGFLALVDSRPWYKNRHLVALNGWILVILITSYSNGYDGSMMNGLLSLDTFESYFNTPRGGKLGLLNAIQNIGSLAGYPFAPYVTDWVGRRKSIFLGAAIMITGAAIQTAAQNLGMFVGARFLIGFGLTFSSNAGPLLVSEIAYPTQRGPLTSAYNTFWYLGSIVAAWTTFGTFYIKNSWSWRIPSAVQALPPLLQVFLIWFVPESPRWLVSKGREAEALRTLGYYHAGGNEQDPLVEFEFTEIKESLAYERNVVANVGYRSLFSKPGNLKRMRIIIALAFFSQWSGNGLVSYYLHAVFDTIGITDTKIQLLINGILQLWNIAFAFTAALMCERAGRRSLFLSSLIGMLVFFTIQTVCSARFALTGSQPAAHAVIAFIFLFYASYDIAFTPLIVSYTVEILPFDIRAKGFNVFMFTISASAIFNQYVNPIALGTLGWKYYIVYDCWLALELVFCYFFIIETKNRTLEETSVIFDGEELARHVFKKAAVIAGLTDTRDSGSEKDEKITVLQHEVLPVEG